VEVGFQRKIEPVFEKRNELISSAGKSGPSRQAFLETKIFLPSDDPSSINVLVNIVGPLTRLSLDRNFVLASMHRKALFHVHPTTRLLCNQINSAIE